MLKIVALYLCWTIFLVSGDGTFTGHADPQPLGQAAGQFVPIEPTDKPAVTTEPPPTTTTLAPSTTTMAPTTTPTTVPSNVTTSSTASPPTTNAPNATTLAPNVTTLAPVTTPKPVPTTPIPAPKDGTWMVNGTNETCIVIRMAVQFNVSYVNIDNKTVYKVLTLPTDSESTNVTGLCGKTEQNVNISWHGGNDSLNIHFVKNDTTKRYTMHHVELSLGAHEFPDSDSNETMKLVHEADQFPTGMTNSYRCLRLQKLDLKRDSFNGTFGNIEVSDLQFQAFRSEKTSNFGDAQDCSPDVPDVVPIAVGCALTALVIIVLAAYLIGRRRSQARGYLSM